MTTWRVEDVTAVAPDASSLAAARKLARPASWIETGSTDLLVWGRCQGSGREPYQVSVDLSGPAYRCSCPSRKIPCKHVLALLLLWVEGDGTPSSEPADFVQEWADDRAARAARRSAPTQREDGATTEDPEAAARRLAQRTALMTSGVAELELWLADMVRGGLAAARRQPLSWWDATAARLVDAQLPGLADRVRRLGSEVNRGDEWAEPLLADVGLVWAATRAWTRRTELDEHTTGDLRAVLGWPVPTEQVRAADRVADTWLVLGVHRTETGRLAEQRTWLAGEGTGHVVQVLDFAAGGHALPVSRLAGARLRAEVSRYPGAAVRRGLFATDPEVVGEGAPLPPGGDLEDAFSAHADALAANPWTPRVPVVLGDARLVVDEVRDGHEGEVRAVDRDGRGVRVLPAPDPWPLVALGGGGSLDLFGELEDGALRVLSASGAAVGPGIVTA